MKIHVDVSRDEMEIIDVFCNAKGMSRPQVLKYAWRTYLTSEKIMQMENDIRRRFANQQNWETPSELKVGQVVEVDNRVKNNYCACGKKAKYRFELNKNKLYKCWDCAKKMVLDPLGNYTIKKA